MTRHAPLERTCVTVTTELRCTVVMLQSLGIPGNTSPNHFPAGATQYFILADIVKIELHAKFILMVHSYAV